MIKNTILHFFLEFDSLPSTYLCYNVYLLQNSGRSSDMEIMLIQTFNVFFTLLSAIFCKLEKQKRSKSIKISNLNLFEKNTNCIGYKILFTFYNVPYLERKKKYSFNQRLQKDFDGSSKPKIK